MSQLINRSQGFSVPNSRAIGSFAQGESFDTIFVNIIKSKSTGNVTIENAFLTGSIGGPVLGAPNGIATLGPTGVIPPSQLGGALLTGLTSAANTALGVGSLISLAGGTGNSAVGVNSGGSLTTGNQNVFVGQNAGQLATLATQDVFVGYNSGQNSNASLCVCIGYNTGVVNAANQSVFIGWSAGNANTVGANNTFIGFSSGILNASGSNNTFIGYNSGIAQTASSNNTFVGYQAGMSSTTDNNVYIGSQAGQNSTSGPNLFIGRAAGFGNTTGTNNVFISSFAGFFYPTANACTVVGSSIADLGNTGSWNGSVAIGNNIGRSGGIGLQNVFIGTQIANVTTGLTGFDNVAIGGTDSLLSVVSGFYNIAIGSNALRLLTGGVQNISIGRGSSPNITTGNSNVIIGTDAGGGIVLSSGNVIIGTNAGSVGDNSNNVLITGRTGVSIPNVNNSLYINSDTPGALPSFGGQSFFISGGGLSLTSGTLLPGLNVNQGINAQGGIASLNGNVSQPSNAPGNPPLSLMGPIQSDSVVNNRWRVLCGTVDAAGNPFGANPGFTSSTTGVGQYVVNFNTAFTNLFAAHTTVFGAGCTSAIVVVLIANQMTVYTYNGTTLTNSAFFFTVIGR
jgi:hypothetical protein